MCTLKHVIEELLSRICGQSRLQKTKQQQKKRKIRPQKRKKNVIISLINCKM